MALTEDSTNLQPPDFGPGFPTYPELPQIVRVTSSLVIGGVYSAFVQQFVPPLSLRDREACYLTEPNGITLRPGYYDARLVGSFTGGQGALPLYATACCPTSASSSSSAHP